MRALLRPRDGAGRTTTALHMVAGLATVGLAGYLYVAVVGRVFGPVAPQQVSALIALYLLVNIVGPGVFTALEQETSRAVSHATVLGRSVRSTAGRAARLAALACLVLTVVVLVAWPLGLETVLDDQVGLLVALVIAIVGAAAVYWLRGVLGGQQRFRAYALTFYGEGALRLVPLVVLLVVAPRNPVLFGLAFAVASVVAAAAVWPALALNADTSESPADEGMGRSFALLVGATGLSQTIANLAPVIITYRLPADPVASSVFSSAFVLARVPLFLFAPVLAMLLPTLSRDAAQGRLVDLGRHLRRTLVGVLGVGALGVAAGALVGPWAVQVMFSAVARPDSGVLALLGAATVLMMMALVLQPALVALGRQRAATTGWLAGAVVFVAVLAAPLSPVEAAIASQLAGPLVVACYLGVQVWRTIRPSTQP